MKYLKKHTLNNKTKKQAKPISIDFLEFDE